MLNEILALNLTNDELATIGAKVGADIPFFIHGYKSANVFGIGEIVEPFEDDIPAVELFTPSDIKCDTKEVFKSFRKHLISSIEPSFAEELEKMSSKTILATYAPLSLNDLYKAVLKRYPEFYEHKRDGWFLSGSGSTIFKPKGTITI